jgi:dermatan 4-sulfotransferase 1
MSSQRHFILFRHHALLYGRVPKVANSSIKASLCRLLREQPQRGLRSTADSFWRHQTHGETTMLTATEACRLRLSHFCFSFVRNPFDRIVSAYNNKIIENTELSAAMIRMGLKHGMNFADFLDCVCDTEDRRLDIHLLPQGSILCMNGKPIPQFIGHLEAMTQHWRVLQQRLRSEGLPSLGKLPSKNVRRQPGAELTSYFLSDRMADQFYRRYACDFKVFFPQTSPDLLLKGTAAMPEPLQQRPILRTPCRWLQPLRHAFTLRRSPF